MSQVQQIQSKGIFHGLPTFSEDVTGLTAIVAGANGISGSHLMRVLCESPKRWTKIYALCRRPPPGDWPAQVEHVSIDLLQDPEVVGAQMKERGVKAEYAFFFAYIQAKPEGEGSIWSAADELVRINTLLLNNFLEGLALTKALPKRILLQLGAKYYGVHLGPAAVPQEETDPRVLLEPNFYYTQEDCLRAAADAAMNICLPIAIYATIQKHLGKSLDYPSDLAAWEANQTMSSAHLKSYLTEWVVLTNGTEKEQFNAGDDCPFTWGKFWPKLAALYSLEWTGPNNDSEYIETQTPYNPPPRGFGPPGTVRTRFTLTEWAKQQYVQDAWAEIAEKNGLVNKDLGDVERIFGFLDAAISWPYPIHFSATKAKKLGFFGFVDSTESIFKVFEEFADMKMLPKLP
ncbi:hypothetical protein N7540_011805 [Penicillium herquei]|nr:hypothetical protein N7540_011805 [Penicillium herquei]